MSVILGVKFVTTTFFPKHDSWPQVDCRGNSAIGPSDTESSVHDRREALYKEETSAFTALVHKTTALLGYV